MVDQKLWQLHYNSIDVHADEITQLRDTYPGQSFCFGGDLNQSRDGRKWYRDRQWYGTPVGRDKLSKLLKETRLICVTEDDFFKVGRMVSQSLINHLCFDVELARFVESVDPWEATEFSAGKRNSDHSGVCVNFDMSMQN